MQQLQCTRSMRIAQFVRILAQFVRIQGYRLQLRELDHTWCDLASAALKSQLQWLMIHNLSPVQWLALACMHMHMHGGRHVPPGPFNVNGVGHDHAVP